MIPSAYVITCLSIPQSVEASKRCILSAIRHGITARDVPAFVPADGPEFQFGRLGWPTRAFTTNHYSRPDPCMACFLSHASAWQLSVTLDEPLIVCEHDAVFVRPLPPKLEVERNLVNLGKPSFGNWKTPPSGINPLVSGPHLKGAHCYFLHPKAARDLLDKARTEACPTDVFLSLKRFPFIRESFPYSAECHETVTTIQNPAGCAAKHRKVEIV